MRLLHTSDWHLGQHFIGRSRAAEHQKFFAWLLGQVQQQALNALIVAGDVFDTATPPSYARELYNQFIVDLQPTGCQLVILGGNHDSPAVLAESKQLLAKLNTMVIPAIAADPADQLILLNDQQGSPGCLLAAIPYLRPRDLLQSQAGQSGQQKQQDLQQAIAAHCQQLYELAQQYNLQHQQDLPIVLTGHLTTVGVSQSESVRDIYIGNLEAFSASAFPPADYIALGHIHQAQQLNSANDIRYSGSPIALSFDEANQQKQAWLIEFTGRKKQVTSLAIPSFQALRSIRGSLGDVQEKVQQACTSLAEGETLWLELVITETDAYLNDVQQRVEPLLQNLPVELLRLRRMRSEGASALQLPEQLSLHELTPQQVWQARLADEMLSAEQVSRLTELHNQVLANLEETA
jgi:exonuclease SbcD